LKKIRLRQTYFADIEISHIGLTVGRHC